MTMWHRSELFRRCSRVSLLGITILGTLFCGGFGAGQSGKVQAAEAATSDASAKLASRVRTLVRRLSDDQLAVRREAEQQLVQLGPQILSLLPVTAAAMPAETAHRVARVRQQLEQAQCQ